MMITFSSVPSHSQRVVARKIKGEYLLVPLANDIADMNSLYRLNETGVFIWEAVDGRRSVGEITDMLVAGFEVSREEAERDVLDFLASVSSLLDFE